MIEIPSLDSLQDSKFVESDHEVSIFKGMMTTKSSHGTMIRYWLVATLGSVAVFLVGLGIGAVASGLAMRWLRIQWQQLSADESL
jgi:hypothetical protein